MPGYEVIAAASETLSAKLSAAISGLAHPPPTADISDLRNANQNQTLRLTLFLFEVAEDVSARNKPRVRGVQPPDLTLTKPPMALCLRYLVTPWGGDMATEQRLLGRAMQVLYDGAIVSGPDLKGVLAGTNEALKVTLAPLSLDSLARVWWAIQLPYRLSLSYEVRVVNLDSETMEMTKPVNSRTLGYGQGSAPP